MVFVRGKEKTDLYSLFLNNVLIDRVKYTKFLGVIIEEKLNWTHHISYIKDKISKGFGIILRSRKFFTKSTLLKLYNLFVLPYLIYCVEIWGNASEIHILPIITLQKKNYSSSHLFTIISTYQKYFLSFKNSPFQEIGYS